MNQADGISDMVSLLCGSVWGRAQKRNNGCCLVSGDVSRRKLSPALTLMPDASVSPCMPLVPFQLLPWCWIPEGVSLCKSYVCYGPFKRRCRRIPLSQPHCFLQLEVMEIIFLALKPWAGWSGVGLGSLILRYPSQF